MFSSIKNIDAQELAQWMADDAKKFRIIDVREPREIAQGSISGAEAMPMSVLGSRLNELEKDEHIVFICRSGARSGQVCAYLAQNGFDSVFNLHGGVMGWAQNGFEFVQVA